MAFIKEHSSIKDIVICEDHPLIQAGIKISVQDVFPDLSSLRIGGTGKRVLTLIQEKKPDLVLVDLGLPDMSGTELIQELRSLYADLMIIVITSCDQAMVLEGVRLLNVQGIILKSSATEYLMMALRHVEKNPGKVFLDPSVKLILEANTEVCFTPREKEILGELVKGQSNQLIADKLGLSLATVRTHRANILQKSNIRTGAELIAWYLSGQGKRY